jgi:hypothetical protein
MVYPQHWLFQWGGTIGPSATDSFDVWTNSIRMASVGPLVGEPQFSDTQVMSALKQKLQTAFATSVNSTGLGYSNATWLRWVKFNKIGPDGRYASGSVTNVLDVSPTVSGSGSPVAWIPQVALAISFMTPVSRGLAKSGRVFLPMPATGPTSGTMRLDSAYRSALATNWGNFLHSLADLPGIDLSALKPSVVSGVREGARQPITGVRVGDVYDTVRSRRNAIQEGYSFFDLPGTQL